MDESQSEIMFSVQTFGSSTEKEDLELKSKRHNRDLQSLCSQCNKCMCRLCNGPLETSHDLYLFCPFEKVVWNQVITGEHFDVGLIAQADDFTPIGEW